MRDLVLLLLGREQSERSRSSRTFSLQLIRKIPCGCSDTADTVLYNGRVLVRTQQRLTVLVAVM
jgi:hypothetical protein